MAPPGLARAQPGPEAFAHGSFGRPRLWCRITLVFVLLSPAGLSCLPLNPIARQDARWNALQKCQPGFYLSEHSGACVACTDGKDFTNRSNTLSSCQPCSECFPDKEMTAPCTRTTNTQCRCKPGTFQDDNSPEFCQKCAPECPAGKVEARPCTPWNDRKCVDQESGSSQLGIIIPLVIAGVVVLLLLLLAYLYRHHWSTVLQGCGVDSNWMNRVFNRYSCAPGGREAMDNVHNTILSDGSPPSTPASEEELEHQKHAELSGVTEQSPGESECLLRPAGAEGSQRKRELLVPANGADPVESLKLFFDYFIETVPFNCWKRLMRQVGLTSNEIQVAEAQALHPPEQVYEMLMTWVNKVGRAISVNTLLDALERLGHRNTKEKIRDHLLASRNYICVEDAAVS